MSKRDPLVSVILPAYNEAGQVERTLSSLQNQTYGNIEYVIIDDGSTDQTIDVVRDATAGMDNINILSNRTNMGKTFSTNRGAMHADGEYIVFHDADDISTPGRIERQVKFLENNPEVGVVGSAYYYINPSRNEYKMKHRATEDKQIRQAMARESSINIGTAMFRARALYNTDLLESENVEGYELIIEIGKDHKLANLPELLYVYYINEGSRSRDQQFRKKLTIMKRNVQAIHHFELGYGQALLSVGWLLYLYAPDKLKEIIRLLFSPTDESNISIDEWEEIKPLLPDEVQPPHLL